MVSGVEASAAGGGPMKLLKDYSGELKEKNVEAPSSQGTSEIFVPSAAHKMAPKGLKP